MRNKYENEIKNAILEMLSDDAGITTWLDNNCAVFRGADERDRDEGV